MKRMIALWHGLTALVSERRAYLQSVRQERTRRKQQRRREPLTTGQLWHDLLLETTDTYHRGNTARYAGGTAAPSDEPHDPPQWVTPRGVDQSMLYRYQIAHVVHQALPEARAQSQPVKVGKLRVVRKRRTA